MRRGLTILAGLIAVATLTVWLATGANRGFTKTSVPVERTDEITGITIRDYQPGFVAGVELLGLGLGVAGALFAVSRLCRSSKRKG